jgi:hypothetical protein
MSTSVTINAFESLYNAELLVNTKTTWNFQRRRPHRVLYTLSQVTSILTTEVNKNNFEISFNLTLVFTVS